jgi:hypothetical protein
LVKIDMASFCYERQLDQLELIAFERFWIDWRGNNESVGKFVRDGCCLLFSFLLFFLGDYISRIFFE